MADFSRSQWRREAAIAIDSCTRRTQVETRTALGFPETRWIECSGHDPCDLSECILHLVLRWGKEAQRLQEPVMVEPPDPLERRELHIVQFDPPRVLRSRG